MVAGCTELADDLADQLLVGIVGDAAGGDWGGLSVGLGDAFAGGDPRDLGD